MIDRSCVEELSLSWAIDALLTVAVLHYSVVVRKLMVPNLRQNPISSRFVGSSGLFPRHRSSNPHTFLAYNLRLTRPATGRTVCP